MSKSSAAAKEIGLVPPTKSVRASGAAIRRNGLRRPTTFPPFDPDQPYAFLIMQFDDSEENRKRRCEGIDEALKPFGYPIFRIDEIPHEGAVVDAMIEHIAGADFVVADLTGNRPNCYYEVGYAHALKRPVVLTMSNAEKPEFDIGGLNVLFYRDNGHLQQLLKDHVLRNILTSKGPKTAEDPCKGAYGRRAFVDPYIVTGRITRLDPTSNHPADSDQYRVALRVRSVDPRRPLRGKVTFHLHDTFNPRHKDVDVVQGVASLVRESWGTFTVGVDLRAAKTQLEIDLTQLPGSDSTFRAR